MASMSPPVAMHWMIAPLAGRDVLMHEGGTGGFSSLVGFDPAHKRGVVILSDTALTVLGGLGSLGAHLLDPSVPPGTPRPVPTPGAILAALTDNAFDGATYDAALPARQKATLY